MQKKTPTPSLQRRSGQQEQQLVAGRLYPTSKGQENAVPLRNLESMTGLDGRTIRAMIATERRAGIAVLSDNATGYYLPANEEEKARFVRSMRHRAKEILLAADAVERT